MHSSYVYFAAGIFRSVSVPGSYTWKLELKPIEHIIDRDNLEDNYISGLRKSYPFMYYSIHSVYRDAYVSLKQDMVHSMDSRAILRTSRISFEGSQFLFADMLSQELDNEEEADSGKDEL